MRRARFDAERLPRSCHRGDGWDEVMQRAMPQRHGMTVQLVYFSLKTGFLIQIRPMRTAGRRLCIDPDDVRMCLGNVMCLGLVGSDFELLYIQKKYTFTISRQKVNSLTANRVGRS